MMQFDKQTLINSSMSIPTMSMYYMDHASRDYFALRSYEPLQDDNQTYLNLLMEPQLHYHASRLRASLAAFHNSHDETHGLWWTLNIGHELVSRCSP